MLRNLPRCRRVIRVFVLLAALVVAAPATAASPSELLAAVSRQQRFPEPTRADVRIDSSQDGATTSGAAVLLGRGHTIYVETRDGTRALLHPGKIVVPGKRRPVRAAPGARLGASGVFLEDLVPVTPWMLKVPQVSDEGPTGTVLTGAPAFPSARVLIVLTIMPDRAIVSRAKLYEKSISDLASFVRNDDFVDVAGHARQTHVTVERSRDGLTTRLELAWRPAPETPPAVFTPAALRAKSPIAW